MESFRLIEIRIFVYFQEQLNSISHMKKVLISAFAVLVACSAFAQGFGGRRSSPNDTLRSTVVEGNRVVFQIYAPNAQNVSVSGDLGAPVRFEKQENGVWKGRLATIADGVYRYQFNVDGISVYDPKSELAGETRALLKVQPKGDEFFAMKDVPHGAVAQRWYYSRTLGTMRRMHVWTPAGYEKNADKLPVFYLIHGGGDNDASWPGVGAAGLILDNLLAEGKMVPMIVVMPNGTVTGVPNEVPPFAEDMLTDIIPFIEKNYNVKTDKDSRAIAGLSMGGMETMEVAFPHFDMFSWVWVMSSSFAPGQDPKAEATRLGVYANAAKMNQSFKMMVFSEGGQADIAYQNFQNTKKELDAAGLKYEYVENAQAGHTWVTWRADLQAIAPKLFK